VLNSSVENWWPTTFGAFNLTVRNATLVDLTAHANSSVILDSVDVFRFEVRDSATAQMVGSQLTGGDILARDDGAMSVVNSEGQMRSRGIQATGNGTIAIGVLALTSADGILGDLAARHDPTVFVTAETAININGDNAIDGNAADNAIFGGDGDDLLRGFDGTDALEGGAGNDTIDGGLGAGGMNAGAGDDVLIGGAGNDYLVGGTGNGTYRFGRGGGADWLENSGGDVSSTDRLVFDADVLSGDR
jgi:Ca2+-binding RTX toxin-like protein